MIRWIMPNLLIHCNKSYIIRIFLLFSSFYLNGQRIIPLQDNLTIKQYLEANKTSNKSTEITASDFDTLNIPFFDDFSKISVYPDPKLWSDNQAFINASFPVEPITYGAATLDALDSRGNVYQIDNKPSICDRLTSLPIDLSAYYGLSDTIYLSFFYQAQGNGEPPEARDSLFLELYSPKDTLWIHSWSTPGIAFGPFQQQIIEIPDSLCQNGFRFRFSNYVSMSANDTKFGEGALGNFDIWNLDYIRLNNNTRESHEKINDISIIYPLKSSFRDYQSIPWDHVDTASFNYKRAYIPLTIRMNNKLPGTRDTITIGRGYFMRNVKTGNYIIPPFKEGEEKLVFDSIYVREDAFLPIIKYDGTGIGIIETGAFLIETNDVIKYNDTVTRTEYFQNHYAYDDGTPERGFGNPGPAGGIGSAILVHFEIYRTDYLRAIDIYFNETLDHFTGTESFRVCVYSYNRNDSLPGNQLYVSNAYYYPDTTLGPGEFTRIILDSALFIRDDICVGIIQNTDEFLNIGYDINNKNKKHIYINNYGYWESMAKSSDEDGSLMIRPVMSRNPMALGIKATNLLPSSGLRLSPNPATDYIRTEFVQTGQKVVRISVYDVSGNLKYYDPSGFPVIYLHDLTPGIYMVKIETEGRTSHTAKFIKSR
jgi:hypothetical protein